MATTMKRKREVEASEASPADGSPQPSKILHLAPTSPVDVHSRFSPGLFDPQTITKYRSGYQNSEPYRHGVISQPISDPLLRSVRAEVLTHISFSRKETDIYKIQQSGDLVNLDGLDPAQLAHLSSLVKLRDALYSAEFRTFLQEVTGVGKLSGKKTDMAINIYTPGSYLLCHDDVIGSRRVSYILYLTDPDEPWRAEWGGGLRLYATENRSNQKGEMVKVPVPEHVKLIPPRWGQLSFFAVQPGESFHDVEEVYHPQKGGGEQDGEKRVRMAISGWYHIPQEGEDGYEAGLEEKLAERSSLSQLQGKEADEFDEPRPQFVSFDEMEARQAKQDLERGKALNSEDDDPSLLTEHDLDHLLQYISPSYLHPGTAEELAANFEENSFLQLDRFLSDKFANTLKDFISKHDRLDVHDRSDENKCREWKTARPPHKHRFLFQQPPRPPVENLASSPVLPMGPSSSSSSSSSPEDPALTALLTDLFPSPAFRKWLSLITGLKVEGDASLDLQARRFRRGKDYALASAYEGENPRLEFSLGYTASGGWEDSRDDHGEGDGDGNAAKVRSGGQGEVADDADAVDGDHEKHIEVGGEEVYMAADEEDDAGRENVTNTSANKGKADPAIYRSSTAADADGEDDAILLTDPPAWNVFSIVLRDRGTLRFVKYVSRAAEGDRWDIKGVVELGKGAWDEDENEDEDGVADSDGDSDSDVENAAGDSEDDGSDAEA